MFHRVSIDSHDEHPRLTPATPEELRGHEHLEYRLIERAESGDAADGLAKTVHGFRALQSRVEPVAGSKPDPSWDEKKLRRHEAKLARQREFEITATAHAPLLPPEWEAGAGYLMDHRHSHRLLEILEPGGGRRFLGIQGSAEQIRALGATPERLTLLSGACLFSAHHALAHQENGRSVGIAHPYEEMDAPVRELEISEELSIYEAETVKRLSALAGEILATAPGIPRIELHVPRVEYYLYVMEAWTRGDISEDQARQWLDAVDRRSETVRTIFTNRMARAARAAGAAPEIDIAAPLEPLGELLRWEIGAGNRALTVSQLSAALLNARTRHQPYLAHLLERRPAESFGDLNHTGYVAAYLSRADEGGVIALENRQEAGIYHNAERSKHPAAKRVVALYPCERAIADDSPSLYFLPYRERLRNGPLRQILR
jgi:hypothetical protein